MNTDVVSFAGSIVGWLSLIIVGTYSPRWNAFYNSWKEPLQLRNLRECLLDFTVYLIFSPCCRHRIPSKLSDNKVGVLCMRALSPLFKAKIWTVCFIFISLCLYLLAAPEAPNHESATAADCKVPLLNGLDHSPKESPASPFSPQSNRPDMPEPVDVCFCVLLAFKLLTL